MLLTNQEKNKMYLKTIYLKLFNSNGNFNIDIIKENFKKNTIKELNGFTYIYGHSDEFGYYFFAMDKDSDGFVWLKPYDCEEVEEGFLIVPKETKYNYIKAKFYTFFDMESFRNELLSEIQVNYIEELEEKKEITITNFLMRLFFSHRLKIKKPIQSKLLCQYFISLVSEETSSTYGIDDSIKEELDLKIDEEIGSGYKDNLEITKVLISGFIIFNMEKYIKKGININKLLNDINIIYLKDS